MSLGILVDDHPLLGRIPRVKRPEVVLLEEGAWACARPEVMGMAERMLREGLGVPASLWRLLRHDEAHSLVRRGALAPLAGGGQQETYRAVGALFAITATIHTHMKILGGATQQATWTMAEVSFDGTSGLATLEYDTSTEASAGTAGTAPTMTQVRRFPAVTAVTTATGNFSAEGTTYTAINVLLIPMPTAPWIVQYPLGRELETQPTATTNGKALLVRASTTVNCNTRAMVELEE